MAMTDPHQSPAPSDRDGAPAEPSSWREAPEAQRFLYRWGGQLSATLIRIRNRFHGDLDQYLLFLVFILAEIAASGAQGGRRGLNALSLSEITQIPRETARRKLLALAEAGYLKRDEEGLYYLGDAYGVEAFFEDLRPLIADAARLER